MDFPYDAEFKNKPETLPLTAIAAIDDFYLWIYPWGALRDFELVHVPAGSMAVSKHVVWSWAFFLVACVLGGWVVGWVGGVGGGVGGGEVGWGGVGGGRCRWRGALC